MRDQLKNQVIKSKGNIILALATGMGKTALALHKMASIVPTGSRILIAVPRNVLIASWIKEIEKFHYEDYLDSITFTTYVSLPKHAGRWDVVILDEGHHTSERCQEALESFAIKQLIVCSATLNKNLMWYFKKTWSVKDENIFSATTQEAIDAEVLPEPNIVLLPITLDNTRYTEVIEKKKKGSPKILNISYKDKFKFKNYQGSLSISCTPRQYYNEMTNYIEWAKKKHRDNIVRTESLKRLRWLADKKHALIEALLTRFARHRTLTFCPSIETSGKLKGKAINSKVGTQALIDFNEGKIRHLNAVGMLDEGMNLVDCRIGIFMMINASDKMTVQRVGRLMRHKNPTLIFPYFVNTREEEIIQENIISKYNPELITTVHSLLDIKL